MRSKHRDRRKIYLKSLEQEVLRLSDEKAVLLDSMAVQDENALLTGILTQNNVPFLDWTAGIHLSPHISSLVGTDEEQCLPADFPDTAACRDTAANEIQSPTSTSTSLSSPSSCDTSLPPIKTPQISPNKSEHTHCSHQILSHKRNKIVSSSPPSGSPTEDIAKTIYQGDTYAAQIGVDFVLYLEQSCLGQSRGDLSDNDSSAYPLTYRIPLPSATPASSSSSPTGQLPNIELERLLTLSSKMNLLGVVTPIEAWARIRTVTSDERLDQDDLEILKCEMVSKMQWHGQVEARRSLSVPTTNTSPQIRRRH